MMDGQLHLWRPRHLAGLARRADRPLDLCFIDHDVKPTIGESGMFWEEVMKRLAVLPQAACKVFEPERLVRGSDWLALVRSTIPSAMFADNIRRIHGLSRAVAS